VQRRGLFISRERNTCRGGGVYLFLESETCAEGGGYLFLPGFSSLYDAIHGWMTGGMDGRVR
jgi:hypothetical protein